MIWGVQDDEAERNRHRKSEAQEISSNMLEEVFFWSFFFSFGGGGGEGENGKAVVRTVWKCGVVSR